MFGNSFHDRPQFNPSPTLRHKLAQCLCGPERHTIIALAFQATATQEADDQLCLEALQGMVASQLLGSLEPCCGLCGADAKAWIYEVAPLIKTDWYEVLADLIASQREQIRTAQMFKAAGLAHGRQARHGRN